MALTNSGLLLAKAFSIVHDAPEPDPKFEEFFLSLLFKL